MFGINNLQMKTWVFTSKAAYMQRIQDYVRTGHNWYLQGVIPSEKVPAFAEKMTVNHPVFFDKLKASRARANGQPTGRLMFWLPKSESDNVHWILLVHAEKKEQLDKTEKWSRADDRESKVKLTGYELVRQTKPLEKKPVWTWRYQVERYEDLRDALVLAIRARRDQDLKRQLDVIWGTMGFAGGRSQAKALAQIFKDEWKRHRMTEDPPAIPAGHGYLQRKADVGIWLGVPPSRVAKVPSRRVKVKSKGAGNDAGKAIEQSSEVGAQT
jgi:hypothetical protein